MIGIMGRIFWSRGGRPQEKISITKEENRHNHVFGPIFLDIPIFFKGDAKNYRFLSLSKFCTRSGKSGTSIARSNTSCCTELMQ